MNDMVAKELHRYWSDRFKEMMERCVHQGEGQNMTTLIPADVRAEYMNDAHVGLQLLSSAKQLELQESAMLIKAAVESQDNWDNMRETLESGYRPTLYVKDASEEDDESDYDDDYDNWKACSFANQHTLAYNDKVMHTYPNMDDMIAKMVELGPLEDWA